MTGSVDDKLSNEVERMAKDILRIGKDDPTVGTLVMDCVYSSVQATEQYCEMYFRARTIELESDGTDFLSRLNGPINSINSFFYIDADDQQVDFEADDYVFVAGVKGKFEFVGCIPDGAKSVHISYDTGFQFGDLPPVVLRAMASLAAHFYKNPMPATEGSMSETPMSYRFLLSEFTKSAI